MTPPPRGARTSSIPPFTEDLEVDELDQVDESRQAGNNQSDGAGVAEEGSHLHEDKEGENEAEEVNDQEAARRIGRKRPRISVASPSPELGSQPNSAQKGAKRRRTQTKDSLAVQKQPRPRSNKAKGTKSAGRKKKDKAKDGRPEGDPISIPVQRYEKKKRYSENDPDADILNADIPFARRGGPNVVDVLARMCEETINLYLDRLEGAAEDAEDTATRKAVRRQMRALDAFRDELETHFLDHVSRALVQ